MSLDNLNRRYFLMSAGALSAVKSLAAAKPATGRVVGANDRINVAVIGAGGRGFYVAREFDKAGKGESNAQIVAVCAMSTRSASVALKNSSSVMAHSTIVKS